MSVDPLQDGETVRWDLDDPPEHFERWSHESPVMSLEAAIAKNGPELHAGSGACFHIIVRVRPKTAGLLHTTAGNSLGNEFGQAFYTRPFLYFPELREKPDIHLIMRKSEASDYSKFRERPEALLRGVTNGMTFTPHVVPNVDFETTVSASARVPVLVKEIDGEDMLRIS